MAIVETTYQNVGELYNFEMNKRTCKFIKHIQHALLLKIVN